MTSFIVIVYNGERYLIEAMLSILQRIWDDLELVAIDDRTAEGTRRISVRYGELEITADYLCCGSKT